MSFRQDAAHLQKLANNAFCQTGTLVALAAGAALSLTAPAFASDYSFTTTAPQDFYKSTSYEDIYGAQYNYGGRNAVDYGVRKLCERYSTGTGGYGSRPVQPPMEIAGSVDMLGYHWLHITLNTLLPHCRSQPPAGRVRGPGLQAALF